MASHRLNAEETNLDEASTEEEEEEEKEKEVKEEGEEKEEEEEEEESLPQPLSHPPSVRAR